MINNEQARTGEISGSVTPKQLLQADGTGVAGTVFKIKALAANLGKVYVGYSSGVTKTDGTTDSTTGYQLAAGEEKWCFVDNLSRIWIICDNAGDNIVWEAVM